MVSVCVLYVLYSKPYQVGVFSVVRSSHVYVLFAHARERRRRRRLRRLRRRRRLRQRQQQLLACVRIHSQPFGLIGFSGRKGFRTEPRHVNVVDAAHFTCECVCACVRACVGACVRVRARRCVRACVLGAKRLHTNTHTYTYR